MEAIKLQRLWIMDWFGHLIEQPTEDGALVRTYFTPGNYPDTFILAAWPLKPPARVMFRHAASVAQNLPDAQFVEAGDHVVALQDQDNGNYLSINPRSRDTHWNAEHLNDWERFIPVPKEAMDGLSVLQDHSYGKVEMNGHSAPALVWPSVAENVGNFAWIGGFAFSITRNLQNLIRIGSAPAGKAVEVALVSNQGDSAKLSVVRSAKAL
ncbi:hypothetical protein GS501_06480 [Saccharibacter sp. 17.LH.SD]|uniref:hypothetical protein n=1 Tax=Saccharibacter sp. 17.LH.SD TaxID=2689393 RepID=UPI001368C41F|nr:hypothetical protein [Saccharibacter sp. 17.LH.SD]MXV44688.1 hypothetical protein [Saccharibacter sp. 17.LH.SD]